MMCSTKLHAITCQNVSIIPGSDRNTPDLNVVEDKIYVTESFFCVNRTDVGTEAH
jgi:hypothetical protein